MSSATETDCILSVQEEATWILRDNSAIHPGTWSA